MTKCLLGDVLELRLALNAASLFRERHLSHILRMRGKVSASMDVQRLSSQIPTLHRCLPQLAKLHPQLGFGWRHIFGSGSSVRGISARHRIAGCD